LIAIVLAGGYAKRLWPLTLNQPKVLLPIAGKPIIDHIIEKLVLIHPPIKRIIISTNLRFHPQFQAWLKTRMYPNVELIPDNSKSEEDKPGAVGALANIATILNNEDMLVVAGDNLFTDDLKGFLNFFKEKHASTMALYRARNLNEVRRGAEVTTDNEGRIIEFTEKPTQPKTTLVGACIYAFPAKIPRKLKEYLELELPKDDAGRFIEWLHRQEPVYGYMLKDYLWDIGTMESYKAADKFFSAKLSHTQI
jgi:glucose-1-phosphate thymidylyltransferase